MKKYNQCCPFFFFLKYMRRNKEYNRYLSDLHSCLLFQMKILIWINRPSEIAGKYEEKLLSINGDADLVVGLDQPLVAVCSPQALTAESLADYHAYRRPVML